MKLTEKRIDIILHTYKELFDRVEAVGRMAGYSDLVGIESLHKGNLNIATSEYAGCGEYETQYHTIPLRWVLADETQKVIDEDRKIAKEEAARVEAARRLEEARLAEEKRIRQAEEKRLREIAEYNRLKSIYEPNGETP